MRATRKLMRIALASFGIILAAVPVLAQETQITNGVNWLVAHQDTSGLWGVGNKTPFRDAAVAVDILGRRDADTIAIQKGLRGINARTAGSTDYLARKIIAYVSAGEHAPFGHVDSLIHLQNEDGSWGYQKGYAGNVLETALALHALKRAGYANSSVLGAGVDYLTSKQNGNGGWPFVGGDSSRVYFTAQVMLTLALLQDDFSVATPMQNAVTWLKLQDKGDHGFGTGAASNPFETGLALAAIVKKEPLAPEIEAASTYLQSVQSGNGSWNDDAYRTAMAVFGLMYVAPDLAIAPSEITLSNPSPVDSDVVTISATIRNRGPRSASNILVRFYDADPYSGGVQIGSDINISSLAANASSVDSVTWNTLHLAGDHNLYVLIDPAGTIREPEEDNNIARKSVHILMPPDLLIEQDDIVFNPAAPAPGQPVIVQTTVWNKGEATATSVPLQFWDGPPGTGIPLLGTPYIIPSIPMNTGYQLNLTVPSYFAYAVDYEISVCADINNGLREKDESNNCSTDTLHVGMTTSTVTLNVGLNLLGMPLDPPAARTSFSLLPTIPNCKEIDRWDEFTQRWRSAVDVGSSVIIGDEFPIGARDGFFARVTSAGSFGFLGRGVTQHQSVYLQPGFNLVSIPNQNSCYKGYTLIGDIPGCTQGKSWNGAGQSWWTANKSGSTYSGDNFSVVPGKGYFVKVPAAIEWTTHSCDTLPPPVLPDLLLTTASIWLDPNPAPAGYVGIGIKLYNMGNATAVSPLVSVFKGDPNAGGQELRYSSWPNIPAYDSSDWLGWPDFSFPTPGSYEIYVVADRYNAMDELDETNNQAHRTLTITASQASPPVVSSDDGQPKAAIPMPLTPAHEQPQGVMLYVNPQLLASRPADQPAADQPAVHEPADHSPKYPEGSLAAGVASPTEAATLIARVNTANITSSSATVTWETDAATDGCVHYGVASVAEQSAWAGVPFDQMHFAELTDLLPATTYRFEVVSGDVTDNNGGAYYTFTSAAVGAGAPWVVYGKILDLDSSAADAVVVSATLRRGATVSHLLSDKTGPDGTWVLNLGNLKNPTTHDVLAYNVNDTIAISARSILDAAGKNILISGTSPQNAGTMLLAPSCDCGVFCDLNLDQARNAVDVVILVNYVYRAVDQRQQRPACFGLNGDWNCSGTINAVDVVYMVNFVYKGSSVAPCSPCNCLVYPTNCPPWP